MASGGGDDDNGSPSGRPGIGVFLSAVSTEFATARNLIRSDLAAKRLEVREQSEFVQGGDATTLERLHTYIDGCSTVVCIIGKRAGAEPPRKAARPFLKEYAANLPEYFMPSYTQWELIFAHAKKKRLLIFHASDDFQPDQAEGVEGDDAELQAEFVEWIFDDLGLNRGNFSTNDELARLVLREDWTTPAANGPKVRAEMTRNGLRGDEEAKPRIQLRAAHDRLAPSLSTDTYEMRGRDRERQSLEAYLTRARENVIEVIGPDGVGKKKLLSQFEGAESVVTTDPEDLKRVEDLVQSAWESLVDPPPGTVLPRDRDRALAQVQALVFAADVDSNDQLRILRDAMPQARFCVTAAAPVTADARRLELKPLGPGQERAMLEIFADRYLLPIPEELEPDIVEICRSVRGNPACIVQKALAAERAPSLEDWIAEQRPLTTAELPADMRPGDAHPDPEEVADVVGEVVPRDVMAGTTSPEATDEAEARCRIMRGSPRYRVPTAAPRDREAGADPEVLAAVLDSAVTWAGYAGSREVLDSRAFVVRMMRWGLDHERWADVIALGRRCEPAMALGGRHGAWQEVLECSLEAARRSGDGAAEGWALHELGSRSLIRDEVPEARELLAAALTTRRVHDPDAAEVSRHNLRLVPGAVLSLVAILVAAVLGITWAGAVVVADDMYDQAAAATAEITPEVGAFALDEPGESREFVIESVGSGSFGIDLDDLQLDGFEFDDNGTCPDQLEPGERCTLTITFVGRTPPATGDEAGTVVGLVVLPLTADGGVDGDTRILLVAGVQPDS